MPELTELKLASARYNVSAYINAKPTQIELIPQKASQIAKPSGGHDYNWSENATPRPPQTFRLVRQSASSDPQSSSNDDGQFRKSTYTLVGAFDAVVDVGDYWDENGVHYTVDSLFPATGYEVRATVTAIENVPEAYTSVSISWASESAGVSS